MDPPVWRGIGISVYTAANPVEVQRSPTSMKMSS